MNILNHPLTGYSFCFLTYSASARFAGFATAQRLGELILHFFVPCVAVHAFGEYNFMLMILEDCREWLTSDVDFLLCVLWLWVGISCVT